MRDLQGTERGEDTNDGRRRRRGPGTGTARRYPAASPRLHSADAERGHDRHQRLERDATADEPQIRELGRGFLSVHGGITRRSRFLFAHLRELEKLFRAFFQGPGLLQQLARLLRVHLRLHEE